MKLLLKMYIIFIFTSCSQDITICYELLGHTGLKFPQGNTVMKHCRLRNRLMLSFRVVLQLFIITQLLVVFQFWKSDSDRVLAGGELAELAGAAVHPVPGPAHQHHSRGRPTYLPPGEPRGL